MYNVNSSTELQHVKKIQAFEMWCFHKILNISRVDKVTNIVLRIGKDPKVINYIKSRKLQCFGHMFRDEKYEILHLKEFQKIICLRREEEVLKLAEC